ncbi:MAG: transposase [Clostridia bacterium]|nr:transposase [Clostridia bacterium]
MIRVKKTAFYARLSDLDRLFECNRQSALVWNDCLKIAKEYHQKSGRWIGKTELQKATKGQYPLHSQSIQAVCHKYLWARDNAKQARDKGYDVRYPWWEKKNYPTKWAKDGIHIYPNGKIELSMGIREGKRQKPITVWVKELPEGEVKEIELIWDRKLMLAIAYEDGQTEKAAPGNRVAAIDMGEIHSIAAVTDEGEALIITGRKLRSIKRLRNKKFKELYKKRSRCKKGSRKWKKYTRAIREIGGKAEEQQKDILHKASRQFVRWAVQNRVKEVIAGDVEGVQRNTSAKKKKNKEKGRGRKQNQRNSQWQFGKLYAYLEYKLKVEGIGIRKTDESYTSQMCPICGRKKKVSGRVYRCYCGYKEHRDVHGAKNILAKGLYGEIRDLGIPVKKITYLRPAA